jgi:hypothetical protein
LPHPNPLDIIPPALKLADHHTGILFVADFQD